MKNVLAALRGAEQLAQAAPIPYLGDAVSAAVKIAELVQDVKQTKQDCRDLGELAAKYTLVIYGQLRKSGIALDGGPEVEPLKDLISVLSRVENLMRRKERKGGPRAFLSFVLKRPSIQDEVTNLKRELDEAVQLFKLQIDIMQLGQALMETERFLREEQHREDEARARERVFEEHCLMYKDMITNFAVIQGQLKEADEAQRYQLNMRDVELVEELPNDDEGGQDSRPPDTRKVTWCHGELRKGGSGHAKAVVVKRFERKDSYFLAEVERAKKLWHPNVSHFLGYCPDENGPFLAYSMAYHVGSFEALGRSVRGVEKFLWVIYATKQILEGLTYLSRQFPDRQWTPDTDIDPITGGRDLIVTEDARSRSFTRSRVLLDVSRSGFERLPNLAILYELTIELNSKTRTLVREIKQDPLAKVAPHKKRSALCKLWRQITSFADVLRDETLTWTSRRIVCPGECFLRSSKEVLDGLCYEDQLQFHTLSRQYYPAWLKPVPLVGDPARAPETETAIKREDRRQARAVEEVEIVESIPQEDLRCDATASSYVAAQRWRRYTVRGLEHGWRLQTMTKVRGIGDCSGWFVNQAVGLRDLPLDFADLSIATALRFTTETYVVDMFDRSGHRKPPPTLYFFERVHDYPRASLDVDQRLDWPWGYWSTEPVDYLEIEPAQDAHRPRRHSIAYVGVTEEGLYRWMQIVDDCLMHIDVRVEVEYCKYTADECLVLEDIQEAAIVEDEYARDRWATRRGSGNDSDEEVLWEEEELQQDQSGKRPDEPEAEEDRKRARCDPSRVATDLYWLRVDRPRKGPCTWEDWCKRARGQCQAAYLLRALKGTSGTGAVAHGRLKAHRRRTIPVARGHKKRPAQ